MCRVDGDTTNKVLSGLYKAVERFVDFRVQQHLREVCKSLTVLSLGGASGALAIDLPSRIHAIFSSYAVLDSSDFCKCHGTEMRITKRSGNPILATHLETTDLNDA